MRTTGTMRTTQLQGTALVTGATSDFDRSDYDDLFDGNVGAAYFLVAALAPGMVERGRGSIINLGSMAGTVGLAGGAAYGATKAALGSMTRSWAATFSPQGVRVNAVAPGPVFSTTTEFRATEFRAAEPDSLGRQLHQVYDGAGLAARMDRDPAVAPAARAAVEALLQVALG